MPHDQEISRRIFLGGIGVLGMAFGFRALEKLALRPKVGNAPPAAILKALGIDRLNLDADAIVDLFTEPDLGVLSSYYQLFWPFHLFHPLEAMDAACERFHLEQPNQRRPHRLHVIRAITRLNAIPDLALGDAEQLAREVSRWHQEWTDPSRPYKEFSFSRREASEAVWQTATATVGRNRENWASFEGDVLADEAVRLCWFFVKGDSPELLLPAVSAFQFLLTYQRALAAKGQPVRAGKLSSKIEDLLGTSSVWFLELAQLYESISVFEELPGQLNEVLIGNQPHRKELVDFAVRVRVESSFQTRRAPLLFVDSASGSGTHTFKIFDNFGVTAASVSVRLARAQSFATPQQGLTEASKGEFIGAWADAEKTLGAQDEEKGGATAALVRSLIPFRSHDELHRIRASASPQVHRLIGRMHPQYDEDEVHDVATTLATEHYVALCAVASRAGFGEVIAPIDKKALDATFLEERSSTPFQAFLWTIRNRLSGAGVNSAPSARAASRGSAMSAARGSPNTWETKMDRGKGRTADKAAIAEPARQAVQRDFRDTTPEEDRALREFLAKDPDHHKWRITVSDVLPIDKGD